MNPDAPTPAPSRFRRLARAAKSALDWTFGLASLVVGLALLAAIPVLNLAAFGYLLHAAGRVATTGRLRDGFVGIRKASRLGSAVLGTFLVFLPVRVIAGLWRDAEVLAPGSPRTAAWKAAVLVVGIATVLHAAWACIRGGRLHHFLWPAPLRFLRWLARSGAFTDAFTALSRFVASLRPGFYLWLGLRGFMGTLVWLALPVGILLLAAQLPTDDGGAFLSLVGGVLLMPVVAWLPFLQVHFAAENRFRALFERRRALEPRDRAPFLTWLALLVTLVSALPLYLLKIELPPRELAWLPALAFVAFILPARLLTGWAVARARRRAEHRRWPLRWLFRAAALPLVLAYVLFVYLNQYLSWNGSRGMLEQHAFLVPAPTNPSR